MIGARIYGFDVGGTDHSIWISRDRETGIIGIGKTKELAEKDLDGALNRYKQQSSNNPSEKTE